MSPGLRPANRRRTAERLAVSIPAGDLVARFGRDEFVIVLESPASGEKRTALLDRLHSAIERPISYAGRVAASMGVAVASSHDVSAFEILDRADRARYRVKFGRHRRSEK